MIKTVNIQAAIDQKPALLDRNQDTPREQVSGAFARLAGYRNGAIFAGSFSGESMWEKHPDDEFVQLISGETDLCICIGTEVQNIRLKAGDMTVVPAECWHRFVTSGLVSLLTITPQPTVHASGQEPPGQP